MDTFPAFPWPFCSHPADPGTPNADPRSPHCRRTRPDAVSTALCHVDPSPEAQSARWRGTEGIEGKSR